MQDCSKVDKKPIKVKLGKTRKAELAEIEDVKNDISNRNSVQTFSSESVVVISSGNKKVGVIATVSISFVIFDETREDNEA